MTAEAGPLKVVIGYHFVAHYREPVFRALLESGPREGIRYQIFADSVSNIPSIKLLDHERLAKDFPGCWIQAKNVWLPKNFLWQARLVATVWRERPDAIIFLGDFHFLSTWVTAVLARALGTSVLMWTHGFLRRERGVIGFGRTLFYRLAHHLLVYGGRARDLLVEKGVPADRIDVVFNSLDHPKQLGVRQRLLGSTPDEVKRRTLGFSDRKVIVFSGRLERSKGIDLLLRAFASLPQERINAHLLCIGDGPMRKELESLAEELSVKERVTFWGSCYDEEVLGALFYLSDLAVSPGPIGLFAIHALTYGTPVLLGDDLDRHGPEFEAVLIGKTGRFFRTGSQQSLAEGILDALTALQKSSVREACFESVDGTWTPGNQAEIIHRTVKTACRR